MSYKDIPEYKHNEGQWRASAEENMDYTQDYPQCLLTLPEAYDGSISHGRASSVKTIIRLPVADSPEGTAATIMIEDNGDGIVNDESLHRLLSWASSDSKTLHHRYGRGSKKMMTKWMKKCGRFSIAQRVSVATLIRMI